MAAKQGSLFNASLLVAGTAIGGGMLALPVLTSLGGFLPSIAIYLLSWLFMTGCGLLFLEVALACPEDSNLLTMATTTLGPWGRRFCWLLYLFFFYCLTVAYIVGCGSFVTDLLETATGLAPKTFIGPLLFITATAPLVVMGTKLVSSVNSGMMLLLVALYLLFVLLGSSHVEAERLFAREHWGLALLSLPVAFASFGFQGVVPTLVSYLGRDPKRCRTAIIVGSTLPLFTYLVWQVLILGIVPTFGERGLVWALANGHDAVKPLRYILQMPYLLLIGQLFAFLALLTSFFGVTLGLTDFLGDGLAMDHQKVSQRARLALIVFLPPLLVSMVRPDLFLTALQLAGGFGSALLLGLLPIMMVWSGRYGKEGYSSPYRMGGGKLLLIAMMLFIGVELAIECYLTFHGHMEAFIPKAP